MLNLSTVQGACLTTERVRRARRRCSGCCKRRWCSGRTWASWQLWCNDRCNKGLHNRLLLSTFADVGVGSQRFRCGAHCWRQSCDDRRWLWQRLRCSGHWVPDGRGPTAVLWAPGLPCFAHDHDACLALESYKRFFLCPATR